MTQYATVDSAGNLTGFYDDAVTAARPPGAVPLTAAQYQDWVLNQTKRLVSGVLVAPPAAAPTAAQALAALAALAAQKMAQGVLFQAASTSAPSLFATDQAGLTLLQGSLSAAQLNLWPATKGYKTAAGAWVAFASADVVALATKVFGYLAACTSWEEALAAKVAANAAADITQGWPANS